MHVPAKYDAAKVALVLIAFHGGGGNPQSMNRFSGLNAKADEAGFNCQEFAFALAAPLTVRPGTGVGE